MSFILYLYQNNKIMGKVYTNKDILEISEKAVELFEKEITTAQLGINYRKINNWNEEELFPFKIPDGKWRSFSFLEACWVKCIAELRELGLPIKSIKVLKDKIAEVPDYREIYNDPEMVALLKKKMGDHEASQHIKMVTSVDPAEYDKLFAATSFGGILVSCIFGKSPVFLLVSADGEVLAVDEISLENEEFQVKYDEFKRTPHISIYLNAIVAELLLLPLKSQAKFYDRILSKEENDLIQILRANEDAEQINIKLKIGKNERTIDLIELQKIEHIDPRTRLTEIFIKDGYEEISLITEKGVLKSVRRKRKIKPKQ